MALDLSGAPLGSSGAQKLGEVLRLKGASLYLRHVDLTSASLTSRGAKLEGAREVFAALRGHATLTSLQLGRNALGKEGAASLAHALSQGQLRALRFLDVSRNSLGPSGVQTLVRALDPSQHAGASSSEAARVVPLAALRLAENNATDFGADAEESGAALASLVVSHPTLTALDVSRTGLTSAAVQRLAEGLASASVLADLSLEGNGVDVDAAIGLATALRSNRSLTRLGLRDNRLYSDGAVALAACLAQAPGSARGSAGGVLAVLDLRDNAVSEYGRALLAATVVPLAPGVAAAAAAAEAAEREAEARLREGQERLARGIRSGGTTLAQLAEQMRGRRYRLYSDEPLGTPEEAKVDDDDDDDGSGAGAERGSGRETDGAGRAEEGEEGEEVDEGDHDAGAQAPPPRAAGSGLHAIRAARASAAGADSPTRPAPAPAPKDRAAALLLAWEEACERERGLRVDLDASPLILRSPRTGVLALVS
jgi:hypothetical protein